MRVNCPTCRTAFRVDPRKVPEGGTRARCSVCQSIFFVAGSGAAQTQAEIRSAAPPASRAAPVAAPQPVSAPAAAATPTVAPAAPASASGSPFGAVDPQAKARRLARALVSDIVTYHPDRREKSLGDGTLKQEFREEIRKSWEEYVGQVGVETAHGTSHFRDALNEILARGQQIF